MLRVFLAIFLLIGAGVLTVNAVKEKVKRDLAQPLVVSNVSPIPSDKDFKRVASTGSDTTSLFVPYWTLQIGHSFESDYNQYLYFGITPGNNGINANEDGYAKLGTFAEQVPEEKDSLLVLRMLDTKSNSKILGNKNLQKTVITETIAAAHEYGFDGVVLDLELSAIPFDSLIAQITDFNASFYDQTKASNLSYGMTMYGDTFYRLRPFDVKALSQKTDMMFIMAYDFHKSRGNPGPNFPLLGQETYGYDMATMSDDFLLFVPQEKLTVVFGLFGYDWQVDKNGKATQYGDPLTNNEINQQFITNCSYENCLIKRDSLSGETNVRYADADKQHSVWFEDMESVEAKQAYLRGKGINAFSFWANSYF